MSVEELQKRLGEVSDEATKIARERYNPNVFGYERYGGRGIKVRATLESRRQRGWNDRKILTTPVRGHA